jgi:hypothetical protein
MSQGRSLPLTAGRIAQDSDSPAGAAFPTAARWRHDQISLRALRPTAVTVDSTHGLAMSNGVRSQVRERSASKDAEVGLTVTCLAKTWTCLGERFAPAGVPSGGGTHPLPYTRRSTGHARPRDRNRPHNRPFPRPGRPRRSRPAHPGRFPHLSDVSRELAAGVDSTSAPEPTSAGVELSASSS